MNLTAKQDLKWKRTWAEYFLLGVNCLFCIVHLLCTLDFVLCAKQTMASVLARWISISSPKWRLVDAYPAKKVANYYNNPQHHHRFPLVIISHDIDDPNLYYARSIFVLKGRYRKMPHKFQSLWRSRAVWKNFSPFLLRIRWCASASLQTISSVIKVFAPIVHDCIAELSIV